MSQLKYRPDVDGLRAIAILPVVLFHAGISGFSGGFVGVDVFFVISGYLITSIIMREVNENNFAYTDFWARRARRILPASALMIVMVLIAGWFCMAPLDYFELARSARSQAYFAGNFYFWEEAGYFEGASELKPLLHTWSLAVEEQFYLLFPLLFLFFHRFFPSIKYFALVLVFIASFAGGAIAIHENPDGVFYLLPGRAWELLMGSLVAIYGSRSVKNPLLSEVISLSGLAMILYSIAFFNASTVFPGINALLPTLGAALIIWTNTHHDTRVKKLLSFRFFVWFGLISYSLYLWHWPVLVFARYLSIEEQQLPDKLLLVGISIVLGYLSWKYIETPFRKKQWLPTNARILAGAFLSIMVIATIAQTIRRAEGYPPRLPERALNYARAAEWSDEQKACADLEPRAIKQNKFCRVTPENSKGKPVFFWGDSHATAFFPGIKEKAFEYHISIIHASKSGCASLLGRLRVDFPECMEFNQAVMEQLDTLDVDTIILANRWSALVYGQREKEGVAPVMLGEGTKTVDNAKVLFKEYLFNTITELRSRGIEVWLIREVPFQKTDIPHLLTRMALKNQDVSPVGVSRAQHAEDRAFVDEVFDGIHMEGVRIIDPTANLCDEHFCPASLNGKSLYRDDDHLSVDGSLYAADVFDPVFKYVVEKSNP